MGSIYRARDLAPGPASSLISWMVTMLEWFSAEASWMKRARRAGPVNLPPGRSLRATSRLSRVSRATLVEQRLDLGGAEFGALGEGHWRLHILSVQTVDEVYVTPNSELFVSDPKVIVGKPSQREADHR